MSRAEEMIRTNPSAAALDEACFECAQACAACADACLGEEDPKGLAKCIRDNLDCADVCAATGAVLSRQTDTSPAVLRAVLEACAASCKQCGDTCAEHAGHHEHCRVCMEACRRCERACNDALSALASS